MNHLNLVLKFRLAGDQELQIKEAARIKVDGQGSLTFYDVHSGKTEKIEVSRLRSFSLLPADSAPARALSACSLAIQ